MYKKSMCEKGIKWVSVTVKDRVYKKSMCKRGIKWVSVTVKDRMYKTSVCERECVREKLQESV